MEVEKDSNAPTLTSNSANNFIFEPNLIASCSSPNSDLLNIESTRKVSSRMSQLDQHFKQISPFKNQDCESGRVFIIEDELAKRVRKLLEKEYETNVSDLTTEGKIPDCEKEKDLKFNKTKMSLFSPNSTNISLKKNFVSNNDPEGVPGKCHERCLINKKVNLEIPHKAMLMPISVPNVEIQANKENEIKTSIKECLQVSCIPKIIPLRISNDNKNTNVEQGSNFKKVAEYQNLNQLQSDNSNAHFTKGDKILKDSSHDNLRPHKNDFQRPCNSLPNLKDMAEGRLKTTRVITHEDYARHKVNSFEEPSQNLKEHSRLTDKKEQDIFLPIKDIMPSELTKSNANSINYFSCSFKEISRNDSGLYNASKEENIPLSFPKKECVCECNTVFNFGSLNRAIAEIETMTRKHQREDKQSDFRLQIKASKPRKHENLFKPYEKFNHVTIRRVNIDIKNSVSSKNNEKYWKDCGEFPLALNEGSNPTLFVQDDSIAESKNKFGQKTDKEKYTLPCPNRKKRTPGSISTRAKFCNNLPQITMQRELRKLNILIQEQRLSFIKRMIRQYERLEHVSPALNKKDNRASGRISRKASANLHNERGVEKIKRAESTTKKQYPASFSKHSDADRNHSLNGLHETEKNTNNSDNNMLIFHSSLQNSTLLTNKSLNAKTCEKEDSFPIVGLAYEISKCSLGSQASHNPFLEGSCPSGLNSKETIRSKEAHVTSKRKYFGSNFPSSQETFQQRKNLSIENHWQTCGSDIIFGAKNCQNDLRCEKKIEPNSSKSTLFWKIPPFDEKTVLESTEKCSFLTLQEAFKSKCHHLITRSKERLKMVKAMEELRFAEREIKLQKDDVIGSLPDNRLPSYLAFPGKENRNSSINARNINCDSEQGYKYRRQNLMAQVEEERFQNTIPKLTKATIYNKPTKNQSKKRNSKMKEAERKKEADKRRKLYNSYRIARYIFSKKLQRQVLKGKVDFGLSPITSKFSSH